ncbi:pyocin activator PrtN family protein [Pseudomonas benzenivorans]|uniref:Pyocin activator protein PrtN n=1 Tax=Pseudomonas benzenivorans TaxID=556533 RepID=A0ABY5H7D9_9PSED|nr:pyocin activator PrtN family protein [Pseudomonas benzenivorans]UTW07989.1 hypothetical protein KDW96_01235 [Pseudomonas benzenivorans]
MPKQNDLLALSTDLERQLTARYGTMLGSGDLWREIGYRSPNAFRQALLRGTLDLPVFAVEGRRGRFALVRDVAAWIARKSLNVPGIERTESQSE